MDVVTYASVMTKMSLASPSIPQGALDGCRAPEGPLGSNQTLVNSKNVTIRCCHICFNDDKNASVITLYSPGGTGGGGRGRRVKVVKIVWLEIQIHTMRGYIQL